MALTLSDRKQVRPLNGALVRPFTTAEECKLGQAVYINADGKVAPADAGDTAITAQGRGIIVSGEGILPTETIPANSAVGVVVFGPVAGFSGMDETALVYVDATTAGNFTQTEPAAGYSMSMGYPLSADVLMVLPQSTSPASN